MGRYLKPVASSYVPTIPPIDIEFYDRKALEKQKRYDLTNQMYNKYLQEQLSKGYIDEEAENQARAKRKDLFNKVITKHGYDLAEGSSDILNAITQDLSNPYYQLRDEHVKQAAIEQQAMLQLGANGINLSKLGTKHLLDKNGNLILDKNRLKANVIAAPDYTGIARKIFDHIKANSSQTDLKNAGLDWVKTTSFENITHDRLLQLASNPYVHKAFKTAAPAYAVDNRAAVGYDPNTDTNQFSTEEGITQFIYGANIDRAYSRVRKQFMVDTPGIRRREAKKKAEEDAKNNGYTLTPIENQVETDAIKKKKSKLNNVKKYITNSERTGDVSNLPPTSYTPALKDMRAFYSRIVSAIYESDYEEYKSNHQAAIATLSREQGLSEDEAIKKILETESRGYEPTTELAVVDAKVGDYLGRIAAMGSDIKDLPIPSNVTGVILGNEGSVKISSINENGESTTTSIKLDEINNESAKLLLENYKNLNESATSLEDKNQTIVDPLSGGSYIRVNNSIIEGINPIKDTKYVTVDNQGNIIMNPENPNVPLEVGFGELRARLAKETLGLMGIPSNTKITPVDASK